MEALSSAVCLKTSFLAWVKCVSSMSARYFDSMVFACCSCFNHLVSTLIPPEKGDTVTSVAEIYTVYITALHPTWGHSTALPEQSLAANTIASEETRHNPCTHWDRVSSSLSSWHGLVRSTDMRKITLWEVPSRLLEVLPQHTMICQSGSITGSTT